MSTLCLDRPFKFMLPVSNADLTMPLAVVVLAMQIVPILWYMLHMEQCEVV